MPEKITKAQFLQLSPEEQKKFFTQSMKAKALEKYNGLPKEEQRAIAEKMKTQDKGFFRKLGEGALDAFVALGNEIDKVGGAPTRVAIGTLIDDFNQGKDISLQKAGGAFVEQFGQDPSKAPTGKDIAKKVGVTEASLSDAFPGFFSKKGEEGKLPFGLKLEKGGLLDISGEGAAGLAIDITADPLNLIPVGSAAKFLGRTVGKATGKVAKSLGHVAKKATGTEEVIDVTGKALKKEALDIAKTLNPKVAPDLNKLMFVARKNGVDLDLLNDGVVFGKDPTVTKSVRLADEINGALQRKIGTISGGRQISREEAGILIREGIDRATSRLFDLNDVTYSSIAKKFPDTVLSEKAAKRMKVFLDDAHVKATTMVNKGKTELRRAQGKEILNAIKSLRKSGGNLAEMVDDLKEVGEAAFKFNSKFAPNPPDIAFMRKLYGNLSEAVYDTVETRIKGGKRIAENLRHNNKVLADFFSDRKSITKIAGSDIADEQVFRRLVENGDSKKIEALRTTLSDKEFNLLKGAYIDNLMEAQKDLNFEKLNKAFSNPRKESIVNHLYTQKELDDIQELFLLGERAQVKVQKSLGQNVKEKFVEFASSMREGLGNPVITDHLRDLAVRKEAKRFMPKRKPLGARVPAGAVDTLARLPRVTSIQVREGRREEVRQFIRQQEQETELVTEGRRKLGPIKITPSLEKESKNRSLSP